MNRVEFESKVLDVLRTSHRKNRTPEEIDCLKLYITGRFTCLPPQLTDADINILCNEIDIFPQTGRTVLCLQGDLGDCYYMIAKGAVNLYFAENKQKEALVEQRFGRLRGVPFKGTDFELSHMGKHLTQLNQGLGFGELSVLSQHNKRRSCACVSVTDDTIILLMHGGTYNRVLKKYHGQQQELSVRIKMLGELPLFSHFSGAKTSQIALQLKKEVFTNKSLVAKHGDKIEGVKIILEGSVRVLCETGQDASASTTGAPSHTHTHHTHANVSTSALLHGGIVKNSENMHMAPQSTQQEARGLREVESTAAATASGAGGGISGHTSTELTAPAERTSDMTTTKNTSKATTTSTISATSGTTIARVNSTSSSGSPTGSSDMDVDSANSRSSITGNSSECTSANTTSATSENGSRSGSGSLGVGCSDTSGIDKTSAASSITSNKGGGDDNADDTKLPLYAPAAATQVHSTSTTAGGSGAYLDSATRRQLAQHTPTTESISSPVVAFDLKALKLRTPRVAVALMGHGQLIGEAEVLQHKDVFEFTYEVESPELTVLHMPRSMYQEIVHSMEVSMAEVVHNVVSRSEEAAHRHHQQSELGREAIRKVAMGARREGSIYHDPKALHSKDELLFVLPNVDQPKIASSSLSSTTPTSAGSGAGAGAAVGGIGAPAVHLSSYHPTQSLESSRAMLGGGYSIGDGTAVVERKPSFSLQVNTTASSNATPSQNNSSNNSNRRHSNGTTSNSSSSSSPHHQQLTGSNDMMTNHSSIHPSSVPYNASNAHHSPQHHPHNSSPAVSPRSKHHGLAPACLVDLTAKFSQQSRLSGNSGNDSTPTSSHHAYVNSTTGTPHSVSPSKSPAVSPRFGKSSSSSSTPQHHHRQLRPAVPASVS